MWEKIKPISMYIDALTEEFKSRGGSPQIPIRSLPKFNKLIWGFKKKEMVVLGARTSQGKSSLATQFALDFAIQGIPVLYLSLEMDTPSLIERMFINLEQVDNFDLMSGKYNTNPEIKRRWERFCSRVVANFKCLVTCGVGNTYKEVLEIVSNINPKPQVVIVDYIQAIKVSGRETREEINEYIRQFRQLAIELDFCGILVSQINREAIKGNNIPNMAQLKSTGVLEEHADKVILGYWEHLYNSEAERDKYRIILAKNRNGITGTHYVRFKPEFYKFEEREY